MLVHYDPIKSLVILCDASPYGIGAVLAKEDSWRCEVPIVLALRMLGLTERNYAQLDHDVLAVVFPA